MSVNRVLFLGYRAFMPRNAKSLDQDILAAFDSGWTEDPLVSLDEEELDRIIAKFGALDAEKQARLRDPVHRIFASFVTLSIAERGQTNKGQTVRPSTMALNELREVSKHLTALYSALSSLEQTTRAVIDADLETRGVTGSDGSVLESREVLDQTFAALDQWIGVVRLGEMSAGKGPNNAATRTMVGGLANWWEEVHGARPKTDRRRGLRPDPFLELCQEVVTIARPRVNRLGIELGTMNLSGIVGDVLKSSGQGRS
jgi:hypothetical protein